MFGSVHPQFQLDRLQIWCAGRVDARHAIEIAELLTLAVTYYGYQHVAIHLCTGRGSRGAIRLMRDAIADGRRAGLTVELVGNAALCRHIEADAPHFMPASRQIGFGSPVPEVVAHSKPMRHAK